jgi:ABC-type dipeptide/oligopeptide/nickel transport system permease component
MVADIVRRALLAGFTIFMVSFVSFVIITLPPGDYVDWYQRHLSMWGREGGLSDGQRVLTKLTGTARGGGGTV